MHGAANSNGPGPILDLNLLVVDLHLAMACHVLPACQACDTDLHMHVQHRISLSLAGLER